MYPFSVGVLLDSFRTNWRDALKLAVKPASPASKSMPPAASFPPKP